MIGFYAGFSFFKGPPLFCFAAFSWFPFKHKKGVPSKDKTPVTSFSFFALLVSWMPQKAPTGTAPRRLGAQGPGPGVQHRGGDAAQVGESGGGAKEGLGWNGMSPKWVAHSKWDRNKAGGVILDPCPSRASHDSAASCSWLAFLNERGTLLDLATGNKGAATVGATLSLKKATLLFHTLLGLKSNRVG